MKLINKHIDQIVALCKQHNVDSMYAFGSVLNENFNEDSDVDFLVQFKEIDLASYFKNYLSFKEQLAAILKRKVDLVEAQTLKNPILIKSIENTKALIYG